MQESGALRVTVMKPGREEKGRMQEGLTGARGSEVEAENVFPSLAFP